MGVEQEEKGVYYIAYKETKRRPYLSIKYPSMRSRPFIATNGPRAKSIYRFIVQLLENNRLSYSLVAKEDGTYVQLPWATGAAISAYLLAVYGSMKPLKYAVILERLISGKMPLARYISLLTELAMDLSGYLEASSGRRVGRRQIVDARAARAVSAMMRRMLDEISL
ncbi:MAG: hypothetical protein QXI39_06660 [Candidatus Bathyarchaeia archaeon]